MPTKREETKLSPEEYFEGLIDDTNKPEEIISFTKVNLPYGWLGNMSPYPIVYLKEKYKTAEALFQSLRFSDISICRLIREQKSPMTAKSVAKEYTDSMVVQPMSVQDLENMKMVLELKVDQHPEIKQQLIDTGSKRIIEDCSARPYGSGLFWGAIKRDNNWVGENKLGQLWMEIRSNLISK